MTYVELRELLDRPSLFTASQIDRICHTVGKPSLGNAVIACELLDIKLAGSDVDALYSAAYGPTD